MARYVPTPAEVLALGIEGWLMDDEGWWWRTDEAGPGRTYREARREQDRRAKKAAKGGTK